MLRKFMPILAAVMVVLPLGGGAHTALGRSVEELIAIRAVARWALGTVELVLMCSCLVMLCLIAPRFRGKSDK
jgi:hypothetical protein